MSFLESYNPIDLFILGTLLVSLIFGFWKGFIRSLSALAGVVLGVLAAIKYHVAAQSYLSKISSLDPLISTILSMILIFVGIQMVFVLIRRLLDALIDLTHLSWADRIMGGVMGIAAGGLVVAAAVQAVLIAVPELSLVKSAKLVKPVEHLSAKAMSYAPKEATDHVQSLVAKWKGMQELSSPTPQKREGPPGKAPAPLGLAK